MFNIPFLVLFLTLSFPNIITSAPKCKITNRFYAEHLCTSCSCSADFKNVGSDIFTLRSPENEDPCFWTIIHYKDVSTIRNAKYGGYMYASSDKFNVNSQMRRVFEGKVKSGFNSAAECYWIIEPLVSDTKYSTIKSLTYDEYLYASDVRGKFGRRGVFTRIESEYNPENDTTTHWTFECD